MTDSRHPWEELGDVTSPDTFKKFFAEYKDDLDAALQILKQYAHETNQIENFNFFSDLDELNKSDVNTKAWKDKYLEFQKIYIDFNTGFANPADTAPYSINIDNDVLKKLSNELLPNKDVKIQLGIAKSHLMETANFQLQDKRFVVILKNIQSIHQLLEKNYESLISNKLSDKKKLELLQKLPLDDEKGDNKRRILLEMVLQKAMETKESSKTIVNLIKLGEQLSLTETQHLTNFYAHTLEMSLRTQQPPEVIKQIIKQGTKLHEKLGENALSTLDALTRPKLLHATKSLKSEIKSDYNSLYGDVKNIIGSTTLQNRYNKAIDNLIAFFKADREKHDSSYYIEKLIKWDKVKEEIKAVLAAYLNNTIQELDRASKRASTMNYSQEEMANRNSKVRNSTNLSRPEIDSIKDKMKNPDLSIKEYIGMVKQLDAVKKQFALDKPAQTEKKTPSSLFSAFKTPSFKIGRSSKEEVGLPEAENEENRSRSPSPSRGGRH